MSLTSLCTAPVLNLGVVVSPVQERVETAVQSGGRVDHFMDNSGNNP